MFRERTELPDTTKVSLKFFERRVKILEAVSDYYGDIKSTEMIVAIDSTINSDIRSVGLKNDAWGMDQYGGTEGDELREKYDSLKGRLQSLREKHKGLDLGEFDAMLKTLNYLRVVYYNDGSATKNISNDLFDNIGADILTNYPVDFEIK